ncbi:hypothetical protein [Paenibacillus sp. y28]|uniref:hypothetical protein n=1 Tax=Paenibacillus sp. y28 TaxID=3129110 RepID=UPI00301AAE74
MGGLSGLAGVLWVSKFASAQGDTAMGYELSVIAACVLLGRQHCRGIGHNIRSGARHRAAGYPQQRTAAN